MVMMRSLNNNNEAAHMDSGLAIGRPLSELLADLHIYRIPNELWVPERRLAKNQAIDCSVSAGFIRILAELTLRDVRKEIAHQLGYDILPNDFIFLRSIGRNFAKVRMKQEHHLKAKIFIPPLALEPELYLLENPDNFLRSSSTEAEMAKHHKSGATSQLRRLKSRRLYRDARSPEDRTPSSKHSKKTTTTTTAAVAAFNASDKAISRFPPLESPKPLLLSTGSVIGNRQQDQQQQQQHSFRVDITKVPLLTITLPRARSRDKRPSAARGTGSHRRHHTLVQRHSGKLVTAAYVDGHEVNDDDIDYEEEEDDCDYYLPLEGLGGGGGGGGGNAAEQVDDLLSSRSSGYADSLATMTSLTSSLQLSPLTANNGNVTKTTRIIINEITADATTINNDDDDDHQLHHHNNINNENVNKNNVEHDHNKHDDDEIVLINKIVNNNSGGGAGVMIAKEEEEEEEEEKQSDPATGNGLTRNKIARDEIMTEEIHVDEELITEWDLRGDPSNSKKTGSRSNGPPITAAAPRTPRIQNRKRNVKRKTKPLIVKKKPAATISSVNAKRTDKKGNDDDDDEGKRLEEALLRTSATESAYFGIDGIASNSEQQKHETEDLQTSIQEAVTEAPQPTTATLTMKPTTKTTIPLKSKTRIGQIKEKIVAKTLVIPTVSTSNTMTPTATVKITPTTLTTPATPTTTTTPTTTKTSAPTTPKTTTLTVAQTTPTKTIIPITTKTQPMTASIATIKTTATITPTTLTSTKTTTRTAKAMPSTTATTTSTMTSTSTTKTARMMLPAITPTTRTSIDKRNSPRKTAETVDGHEKSISDKCPSSSSELTSPMTSNNGEGKDDRQHTVPMEDELTAEQLRKTNETGQKQCASESTEQLARILESSKIKNANEDSNELSDSTVTITKNIAQSTKPEVHVAFQNPAATDDAKQPEEPVRETLDEERDKLKVSDNHGDVISERNPEATNSGRAEIQIQEEVSIVKRESAESTVEQTLKPAKKADAIRFKMAASKIPEIITKTKPEASVNCDRLEGKKRQRRAVEEKHVKTENEAEGMGKDDVKNKGKGEEETIQNGGVEFKRKKINKMCAKMADEIMSNAVRKEKDDAQSKSSRIPIKVTTTMTIREMAAHRDIRTDDHESIEVTVEKCGSTEKKKKQKQESDAIQERDDQRMHKHTEARNDDEKTKNQTGNEMKNDVKVSATAPMDNDDRFRRRGVPNADVVLDDDDDECLKLNKVFQPKTTVGNETSIEEDMGLTRKSQTGNATTDKNKFPETPTLFVDKRTETAGSTDVVYALSCDDLNGTTKEEEEEEEEEAAGKDGGGGGGDGDSNETNKKSERTTIRAEKSRKTKNEKTGEMCLHQHSSGRASDTIKEHLKRDSIGRSGSWKVKRPLNGIVPPCTSTADDNRKVTVSSSSPLSIKDDSSAAAAAAAPGSKCKEDDLHLQTLVTQTTNDKRTTTLLTGQRQRGLGLRLRLEGSEQNSDHQTDTTPMANNLRVKIAKMKKEGGDPSSSSSLKSLNVKRTTPTEAGHDGLVSNIEQSKINVRKMRERGGGGGENFGVNHRKSSHWTPLRARSNEIVSNENELKENDCVKRKQWKRSLQTTDDATASGRASLPTKRMVVNMDADGRNNSISSSSSSSSSKPEENRRILFALPTDILPSWLTTSKEKRHSLSSPLQQSENNDYGHLHRRQLLGVLRTFGWHRRRARKLHGNYVRYLSYLSERIHGVRRITGAEAADMWKRKYSEELRDTHILREQIRRLRRHLHVLRQASTMATGNGNSRSAQVSVPVPASEPSNEASLKTSATKLIDEIQVFRRQVDTARVRLAAEYKLRSQAENESKLLRAEATERKMNAALTRTQAGSQLPDPLPPPPPPSPPPLHLITSERHWNPSPRYVYRVTI